MDFGFLDLLIIDHCQISGPIEKPTPATSVINEDPMQYTQASARVARWFLPLISALTQAG